MEELVPITLFLSAFLMIFGIRYLSNKEKMAMIERGINPKAFTPGAQAPRTFLSLKFGLLMVGLGIGLLLALFLSTIIRVHEEEFVAVYFGCISIFGGLGLIISYAIEKKWMDNHPKE